MYLKVSVIYWEKNLFGLLLKLDVYGFYTWYLSKSCANDFPNQITKFITLYI